MDPRTGKFRELGTNFTFFVRWRADGKGILYRNGNAELLCDLHGEVTLWRRDDESVAMSCPAYSPDEQWMAFVSKPAHPGVGQRNLWLQPFGGGPVRRLTNHPGQDTHPTWGPDSRPDPP